MLRGIDDPVRLRRFFEEKRQTNLVLRVADVMALREDDQVLLLLLLERFGTPAPEHPTREGRLQRAGTNGYILISTADLCRLDLEELQVVQALIHSYREIREGKGEPSAIESCDCTADRRRAPDPRCRMCSGTGELLVLQELSPEERELAGGGHGG